MTNPDIDAKVARLMDVKNRVQQSDTNDLATKEMCLLVNYDAQTGVITWKSRPGFDRWNARYANTVCGHLNMRGYRAITYKYFGKNYCVTAHKAAWFIAYGKLPDGDIDHINQDKLDNRICNLRDVSRSLNQRNKRMLSQNTSGITGVHWHKVLKKWCAVVSVNGKRHALGNYSDIEQAAAVVAAFRQANDFTALHGVAA